MKWARQFQLTTNTRVDTVGRLRASLSPLSFGPFYAVLIFSSSLLLCAAFINSSHFA